MHTYLIFSQSLLLLNPGRGSLIEDIAGMTLFSKGIMAILLFMSIVSWAIMVFKYFFIALQTVYFFHIMFLLYSSISARKIAGVGGSPDNASLCK